MTLNVRNRLRASIRLCLTLTALSTIPGWADAPQRIHIVRNDWGGRIDRRVSEVQSLQGKGDRVEIRGRTCLSACTLFLGARDVCIEPDTMFGFHGPTFWGLPLDETSFEYWSEVIASHYNPALRHWYLEVARHRVHGFHRLSGSQIIELGYSPCEENT